MSIIGLIGPIGCGKSTAAEFLRTEYGFEIVKFAGPLKAMLITMGLTHREVEGDLKEKPCELLGGKTPRYAMQTLGTEWGRNLISSDLWLKAWEKSIGNKPKVVVDDARFPNELMSIWAHGGEVWRIVRRGIDKNYAHESEEYIRHVMPTRIIDNCSTIQQLKINLHLAYTNQ